MIAKALVMKHTKRPVTATWIARVLEEIESRGKSQRQIALAAGLTPAAVNIVLKGTVDVSGLVEPLSAFLGIPLPALDATDPLLVELQSAAAGLTSDEIAVLVATAKAFAKKNQA
jgi:transcriptional regulator with XRE-family HTH domain